MEREMRGVPQEMRDEILKIKLLLKDPFMETNKIHFIEEVLLS